MWKQLVAAVLPLLMTNGFSKAYAPQPEMNQNRDYEYNTTHKPFIPEGGSLPIRRQDIYSERDESNATTHHPVILEGGELPFRRGPMPLISVTINEDGSVVIPVRDPEEEEALPADRFNHPEEPIPVMCGTYYLGAGEGLVITSPYYPKPYVKNFKCRWIFVSSDSDELSFTCDAFKLDKKGKDFLGIRHTEGMRERKYKRWNNPSIPRTSGGVLRVRFSSNGKVNGKGFKCTVTHLGVTTTTTTITTTTTTSTPTTTTPLPAISHPKCGLASTRIVNGDEAIPNAYPWMVWTYMQWSNGLKRWCGGTIIHELWVLTAAHCPYRLNDAQNDLYYPSSISVIVGAHQKDKPSASGGYIVEVDTRLIFIHPKYQMPYDIALYKLKMPLVFNQKVAPICLAPRDWRDKTFEGVPVFLAGWGKTETGRLSPKLKFYNTVGYNFTACKAIFGSWMGDTQMCTDGTAKRHSCSGDSGGPVMYEEEGRVYQVGVISFGSSSECNDQFPDGQVKVAAFIDWFESIMGVIFNL